MWVIRGLHTRCAAVNRGVNCSMKSPSEGRHRLPIRSDPVIYSSCNCQSTCALKKGANISGMADGKLNFRVRKASSARGSKNCGFDTCDQLLDNDAEIFGTAPAMSSNKRIRSGDDREARRRKNVDTRGKEGEPVVRRYTRSLTAASSLVEELPVAEISASKDIVADFWHSSLSEKRDTGGHIAIQGEILESDVLATHDIRFSGKSMLAPADLAVAIEHLKCADPRLAKVIEIHEGPKFEKCSSYFTALVRSIAFQQLATKAASTIFGRVVVLCGGMNNVQPSVVSGLSKEQLRSAGLSERKASYLHDLASHFFTGNLSDVAIQGMDDKSLEKALTAVKGIGVWSVHMFMLFSLHRPDVLPVGDLGVRKGFQKLYQLKSLPSSSEMERLSACWQPYRSIGSWYMWRVLDMILPF